MVVAGLVVVGAAAAVLVVHLRRRSWKRIIIITQARAPRFIWDSDTEQVFLIVGTVCLFSHIYSWRV